MTLQPGSGGDAYYLGRGGKQYGPYPWEEICLMGAAGNLFAGDLLWSPGWTEWVPAGTIDALRSLTVAAPVPGARRPVRWWIPVLAAMGVLLIGMAVLLVRTAAPSLKIKDYYPKEGGAGSFVLLEVSGAVEPGEVEVRYGGLPLAVIGVEGRCLGVHIPLDGASGPLRLLMNGREADAVPFTVLAPEVTLLHEERVAPTAGKRVIATKEGITVTIPGGMLKETRTLSISRVRNAAVARDDPFTPPEVYDVSIEGMEQLDGYVEIGIPYDPARLGKGIPALANFAPARWDEEHKAWVDLYGRVDEEKHTVCFITDHLTLLGVGEAAIFVVVVGGALGEVAERWANDKYLSPGGKIRILYSDPDLRAKFPDDRWKAAIAPAVLHAGDPYRPEFACAVQDIAYVFEESLRRYLAAGFADPTVKTLWGERLYTRYVKVKIDSNYVVLGAGEMVHENFWDTIHVPTELLKHEFYDPVLAGGTPFEQPFTALKSLLAHELFHVVQRPYYGTLVTFTGTPHKWWLEATAEWASLDLAKVPARPGYTKEPPCVVRRIGPKFLKHPIHTQGKVPLTSTATGGLDYEYLAAAWVRYLVGHRGENFKALFEAVAAERSSDPLLRLRSRLGRGAGSSFDDLYADFAAWVLANAGLRLADFADPDNTAVAADRCDSVAIGAEVGKVRAYLSGPEGRGGSRVLVFRKRGGGEKLDPTHRPLLKIEEPHPRTYDIEVDDGDALYFLAANGSASDARVGLNLQVPDGEEWRNAAYTTMELGRNGTASVWAVRFTLGGLKIEPGRVEDARGYEEVAFEVTAAGLDAKIAAVTFNYDFGDGARDARGQVKATVAGGRAQATLKHAYEPSPGLKGSGPPKKHILKVDLAHGAVLLESASAEVTVGRAEVVVMPRHSIGPPGATFDMQATARPPGNYRFKWEIAGQAEAIVREGSGSAIAPVLDREGKFAVTVELSSEKGVLLASDTVGVEVTREKTTRPAAAGAWVLGEVVPKPLNIEALRSIEPGAYSNAKFFCGTNFTSSASIDRGKAAIAYTGTVEKGRGGGTERVDYRSTWTDPGAVIRPGRIELTVSSEERGRTKLSQDEEGTITTSAGFSLGMAEGARWGLGSRPGGLSPTEGYACSTEVQLGRPPAAGTCTMAPEIPEGEEEQELHFEVVVFSSVGQARLTMKYRWDPKMQ